MFDPVWTPDMKARLETLWLAGTSTVQIAERLRDEFGTDTTKNAVIGTAHRMGLSISDKRQPRPGSARGGHLMARLEIPDAPPRTHCQYPEGEVGAKDFHYCWKPIQEGSSYCPEHHALCHAKPSWTEQKIMYGVTKRAEAGHL